ncbi:MAG: acyltransferase family protein [Verrucomicrobiales bacterium]|nr:acyltransferase family protein [Verrucomicrobiales bacterium]
MTPVLTSMDPAAAQEKPRYHAMDSLRAVAMLLGILIHALQAHATMNARPGSGLPGGIWLAEFIHAWRMPLFFLISGFFCRMMFHRYGSTLYLKRRWQRIGIPLLLGLLTLSPLFVFTQEQVSRLQAPASSSNRNGNRDANQTLARETRRSRPTSGALPDPRQVLERFDADQNGQIDGSERRAVEEFFQSKFGFVPPPPGEARGSVNSGRRPSPTAGIDSAEDGQLREGLGRQTPWVFRQFGDFIRAFRWFGLHYLWFLWYLLLFVLAAPPVARAMERLASTRAGQEVERGCTWALNHGVAGALLAGLALPLLWAQGGWSLQTSQALLLPFPLFALLPDPSILGFYFVYFLGGWFVHRHVGVLSSLARCWWGITLLGTVAYVASRALVGDLPPGPQPSAIGADPGKRLFVLSLYSLSTGLLVFGWIGFFQRFFNRPSARWRYASDATFWLYLAHQPLLLVLQAGFTHLPGSWLVQVPLVVALATILLLIIYHHGVRDRLIGRILNGPRDRRPRATPPGRDPTVP